ncbi:ABC transporter substrate-binding protein [Nocardia callitridis]|uniref:ABC transporter substrate-binding protein n=1 Tax=Nocardia callitridis TaxID=648753 RepID=A0ABP9KP08_9NOCA
MNRRDLRRALAVAAAAVVLCGVGAGCGAPAPTVSDGMAPDEMCPTEQTAGTVKIGMSSPLAVFAPLLLALQTDAFAGTGLEVSTESLQSTASLPLVARGQLDAQITSLSNAHYNTANAHVPLEWIAPMDKQEPIPAGEAVAGYWARVDRVGSAAAPNLAALKGAKVSTPTRGSGVAGLIMDNALSKVGLRLGDVSLTAPLVGADALTGLINGSVDAAWISAPLEVEAAKYPELVPIAGYEPGITGTSVMVGPTMLNRPDVTVKFLQVLRKVTQRYLTGDYRRDPETAALLAEAEQTDIETVRNAALLAFDPTFSMDGAAEFVDRLQTFSLERGELEYDQPLDSSEIIDTRFTEALALCRPIV